MKYYGSDSDFDGVTGKTGVLLVNLGTPDAPTTRALRRYLSEFLMDPRVIEIPKLFRLLLVKGIIVNFRSHKSAAAYREVWTESGSPLMINTAALTEGVATALGEPYVVELAMRYGQPSIKQQLLRLHRQGCRKLIIVPLYPQYSGSTSGSVFDSVADALSGFRWIPELRFIDFYYQRPEYIGAIASSISEHWEKNGRAQKLVISFHGVPRKYITRGDPYFEQCRQSAAMIASELKLEKEQWMLVFQSRFGAEEWLQPYCDETLKSLPAQGVKSVDIICPGFSADCLETLEEIDGENREYFMEAGGERYSYIPCLNDSSTHIKLVSQLVRDYS